MPRVRAWLLRLAIASIAIAYAVLSHISNSTPNASTLGVVLAIAPLLLIAVAVARGSVHPIYLLAFCAAALLLVYWSWSLLVHQYSLLYLVQQAGAYSLLMLAFGRSLRPGRTPLCTVWATRQHGTLSPAAVRYTRAVTLLWAVFFAAITVISIALYLLTPLRVWSAFANFGTFPLIVALFIGEYLVRGRALPDMQHAGILVGLRAFWTSRRSPADARHG